MELWIRSQDKMLLKKVEMLGIFETLNGYDIGHGFTTYGQYKTKERALEVLDEIQKLFEPKIVLKSIKEIAQTLDGIFYTDPGEYEIEQLSSYVYQMPNE